MHGSLGVSLSESKPLTSLLRPSARPPVLLTSFFAFQSSSISLYFCSSLPSSPANFPSPVSGGLFAP